MKWILWSLFALLSVAALVTAIGWLLPVRHEASLSADVSGPPERVFPIVADVARYADWLEGVNRIDILHSSSEPRRFREHTTDGPIVMEVVESRPPSRFVTRIADSSQPFGGTWTFDIVPRESGSRVTITERGEIYNPIFRFMARFVFGYTTTMQTFMTSLQRKLS
jgi:uncharacterized protein YndB with AHSA1/START domain